MKGLFDIFEPEMPAWVVFNAFSLKSYEKDTFMFCFIYYLQLPHCEYVDRNFFLLLWKFSFRLLCPQLHPCYKELAWLSVPAVTDQSILAASSICSIILSGQGARMQKGQYRVCTVSKGVICRRLGYRSELFSAVHSFHAQTQLVIFKSKKNFLKEGVVWISSNYKMYLLNEKSVPCSAEPAAVG